MSAEERRPLVETAPESTATTTSPSLTEAEAARLTAWIQIRLGEIADSVDTVLPAIEKAKNGNAHQALGYQSWTAYVADKFGGTLARLGKSGRLPVVELLAGQGMSTRAIASVVGVSKDTVHRDLAGVSHETPEPIAENTSLMVEATDAQFEQAITEARADENLSRANVERKIITAIPTTNKVIGIDGKNYTKPKASKPRRRPLPDAYRDHSHAVRQSVESLSRLHRDDRFPNSRGAVWRSVAELACAANELLDLLDDLGVDRHKYGGLS